MKNEKMLLRELGNKLSFVLPKRQDRRFDLQINFYMIKLDKI